MPGEPLRIGQQLPALRACFRNGDWEQLYPDSTLRYSTRRIRRKAA